jgi:hypothetical protein
MQTFNEWVKTKKESFEPEHWLADTGAEAKPRGDSHPAKGGWLKPKIQVLDDTLIIKKPKFAKADIAKMAEEWTKKLKDIGHIVELENKPDESILKFYNNEKAQRAFHFINKL